MAAEVQVEMGGGARVELDWPPKRGVFEVASEMKQLFERRSPI